MKKIQVFSIRVDPFLQIEPFGASSVTEETFLYQLAGIFNQFNEPQITQDRYGVYPNTETTVSITVSRQLPIYWAGINEERRTLNPLNINFLSTLNSYQVLDLVELWHHNLSPGERYPYHEAVNDAFRANTMIWRLVGGAIVRIHSDFMETDVLGPATRLLRLSRTEGALQEFEKARSELGAGEYRNAIRDASNAFESVLKTLVDAPNANCRELLFRMVDAGNFDDVRENDRRGIADSFLQLAVVRNKIGGHGAGKEPLEIPERFARLAVHLCGAYILAMEELLLQQVNNNEDDPWDDSSDLLDDSWDNDTERTDVSEDIDWDDDDIPTA